MGIKVQDIAYVRSGARDLDSTEAFLAEFGMVLSASGSRTATIQEALQAQ